MRARDFARRRRARAATRRSCTPAARPIRASGCRSCSRRSRSCAARRPDARLLLAGKREPGFRRRAPRRGGVGRRRPHGRDLARTLAAAHVAVLPSIGEAFGLVLAEALAAGTPVVAARRRRGAGDRHTRGRAAVRARRPRRARRGARAGARAERRPARARAARTPRSGTGLTIGPRYEALLRAGGGGALITSDRLPPGADRRGAAHRRARDDRERRLHGRPRHAQPAARPDRRRAARCRATTASGRSSLIAIGTLGLLKEGVVGDKFVQQDEADQERAFQRAFTLEAILNGILFVIALVALPLVALRLRRAGAARCPGLVLLARDPARHAPVAAVDLLPPDALPASSGSSRRWTRSSRSS